MRKPLLADIEVSAAGWFFIASAAWELVFNRLFTAMGVYAHAGASGPLAALAQSGQFAVNAVGIMGLLLTCILLPRLAADSRLAPLPARLFLMLTSPLFLPVTCVAIFRSVSIQLILVSYLITVSVVLFLSILTALNRFDGGLRRNLLSKAAKEVLAAAELLVSGFFESLSQRLHLAAEAMFLAVPVFAFLFFIQGRLRAVLRRPPILPLAFAVTVTLFAWALSHIAAGKTMLTLILLSFKSLGITLVLPGGTVFYLIALFFGAFLVGCLVLPSKAVPPTKNSRKRGFGLTCILMAGLQPTHPYLSILVLVGFLYMVQFMLENKVSPELTPPLTPAPAESRGNP